AACGTLWGLRPCWLPPAACCAAPGQSHIPDISVPALQTAIGPGFGGHFSAPAAGQLATQVGLAADSAVRLRRSRCDDGDSRAISCPQTRALVRLTIMLATVRVPKIANSRERIHWGTASRARRRAALRKAGAKRSR